MLGSGAPHMRRRERRRGVNDAANEIVVGVGGSGNGSYDNVDFADCPGVEAAFGLRLRMWWCEKKKIRIGI